MKSARNWDCTSPEADSLPFLPPAGTGHSQERHEPAPARVHGDVQHETGPGRADGDLQEAHQGLS